MTGSFPQITVSTADVTILPLVRRFFHAQGMRAQAAKVDEIIIARNNHLPNNAIIAALRLCPVKGSWLLRSMCVDQNHQRQGTGLYMLEQIKHNLSEKKCYCFPYRHLESFYQTAGFQVVNENDTNDEIKLLYQQYIESGKDILIMQFACINSD